MKIKSVESIVKQRKRIHVLWDGDVQWLSDGYAAYPFHGFPPLSEENIFKFFDIPEDKQGKYSYVEGQFPIKLCAADTDKDELPVKRAGLRLVRYGVELLPLYTKDGIVFIDTKYLAPFSDQVNGYELYERKTMTTGQTYIAVKCGFLLVGIILPDMIAGDKDYVQELTDITTLLVAESESVKEDSEQTTLI